VSALLEDQPASHFPAAATAIEHPLVLQWTPHAPRKQTLQILSPLLCSCPPIPLQQHIIHHGGTGQHNTDRVCPHIKPHALPSSETNCVPRTGTTAWLQATIPPGTQANYYTRITSNAKMQMVKDHTDIMEVETVRVIAWYALQERVAVFRCPIASFDHLPCTLQPKSACHIRLRNIALGQTNTLAPDKNLQINIQPSRDLPCQSTPCVVSMHFRASSSRLNVM
jgi:hypothetical protein